MSFQVRRTAPLLVAMLLVIPILMVGCSRGDNEASGASAQVSWDIAPSPPAVGPATLTIQLKDADGDPASGATISVEGNMNHAGMKPVFSDLSETDPGTYVTDSFEFTMGGDWIITVSGTDADGSAVNVSFDINGVEG